MSRIEKLQRTIQNNPANVRFDDVCKVAENIGFRLHEQSGSHRTYARPDESVLLNFQNVKGKVKL
ncbi:MAG: type II toxin-antitoxin system HicA family toxin [Mariprofundaceae bacterium]